MAALRNPDAALLDTLATEIEAARFQDAAQLAPTAAVIAACLDARGAAGALVQAFAILSEAPPKVLFTIAKTDPAHAALLSAEEIGLTLLAEHDADQARRFAVDPREGFGDHGWRHRHDRPPEYGPALVSLAGVVTQRLDAGAHSVLIARVRVRAARDDKPLVLVRRAYRSLRPAPRLV